MRSGTELSQFLRLFLPALLRSSIIHVHLSMIHPLNCMFSGHLKRRPYQTNILIRITTLLNDADNVTINMPQETSTVSA